MLKKWLEKLDKVARLAVVITVIEVIVLVQWLQMTMTQAAAVAAGFLFVGILIEELVRFMGIKNRAPREREFLLIALGVAVETVTWILPLVLALLPAQTFGILFVGLTVEHAIIGLATRGKFDLQSVVDFSAVEAAGGTIWLMDPSVGTIIVLAITSVLEHVQGIRQGLRLR